MGNSIRPSKSVRCLTELEKNCLRLSGNQRKVKYTSHLKNFWHYVPNKCTYRSKHQYTTYYKIEPFLLCLKPTSGLGRDTSRGYDKSQNACLICSAKSLNGQRVVYCLSNRVTEHKYRERVL